MSRSGLRTNRRDGRRFPERRPRWRNVAAVASRPLPLRERAGKSAKRSSRVRGNARLTALLHFFPSPAVLRTAALSLKGRGREEFATPQLTYFSQLPRRSRGLLCLRR